MYGFVPTVKVCRFLFLQHVTARGETDDPHNFNGSTKEDGQQETVHDLAEGLAELRLLSIRLDLKVVGALICSAIGMIPLVKH